MTIRFATMVLSGLIFAAMAAEAADAARPKPTLAPAALTEAVAGYDRAQIAGDGAALRRYLADDYLLVDGAGALETKEQLIGDFTAPGYKLDPYVVEAPVAKVWHGAAVYGGEVHLSGASSGKRFAVHIRFSDVWRLRSGRWQVVYTQVTRLAK